VGLKPDAERAYVFEKHGRRVALLAFSDVVPNGAKATELSQGIASAKCEEDLVNAIQAARREADFVVLMIHWGGQGSHQVIPRQRQLAQVAVRAGCDAVMGMHPHVLQGIEYIEGKPVFYSLGNFAMSSSRAAQRESVLVRLLFGERGLEAIELVPVLAFTDGVPRVAEGTDAERILEFLDKLCWAFNAKVADRQVQPGEVRQAAKPKLRRQAVSQRSVTSRKSRPSASLSGLAAPTVPEVPGMKEIGPGGEAKGGSEK
jgi:hypothetical protein